MPTVKDLIDQVATQGDEAAREARNAGRVPSLRAPSAPAPRPLRKKSQSVTTSLPPGAQLLVDSQVGGLLGSTRSEVLRFIVVSWLTSNAASLAAIRKEQKK